MALNNAINSPLLGGIAGALPIASGGTGATTLGSGAISSNGSVLSSGTLTVANGGTGAATLTGVLVGNGTSAVTASAQLAVASGGTGAATLTNHGVLIGAGTSAVSGLTVGGDGQILVGSVGANPVFATPTSPDGSITFGGTAGAFTATITNPVGIAWASISGTSQSAAVNTGYVANNSGATTVTLPATAAVGAIVRLVQSALNTGGFVLTGNTGQTIQLGTAISASAGTVSSTSSTGGDVIEVVCTVANTKWVALSSVGSLSVA